jgi:hypothetical protein
VNLDISQKALKDASTLIKVDSDLAQPLPKLLAPLYDSKWFENETSQKKGRQIYRELFGFDLGRLEAHFVIGSLLYDAGQPSIALKHLTPAMNLFYRSKANFSKPTREFLTSLLEHLPPPIRKHPVFVDFLSKSSSNQDFKK